MSRALQQKPKAIQRYRTAPNQPVQHGCNALQVRQPKRKGAFSMAYDSDDGYFHLTPDGWKRQDEEPFPENRVETWQYSMHQASGWSRRT